MTIVVESNIQDIKMFRNQLAFESVLYPSLDGLLKFISDNASMVKTVVLDISIDSFKVPIMAKCIKQMYPHINMVEYSDMEDNSNSFQHKIKKPFNKDGAVLIEALSGE